MNINLTMIGQLIMFAMFTWFCMKFVWPPIVAAMEARKKRIESGLIAAERGLSEHKEAQQKAQEMINQSKDQAAAIIAILDSMDIIIAVGNFPHFDCITTSLYLYDIGNCVYGYGTRRKPLIF